MRIIIDVVRIPVCRAQWVECRLVSLKLPVQCSNRAFVAASLEKTHNSNFPLGPSSLLAVVAQAYERLNRLKIVLCLGDRHTQVSWFIGKKISDRIKTFIMESTQVGSLSSEIIALKVFDLFKTNKTQSQRFKHFGAYHLFVQSFLRLMNNKHDELTTIKSMQTYFLLALWPEYLSALNASTNKSVIWFTIR